MDDDSRLQLLGRGFLTRMNGEEPTESQIVTFCEVAKRGNKDLLNEGDIVLPLKSPSLKKLATSNSIFYRFITDPTQKNLELLETALSSGDHFVTQVWMNNDMLRLSVDRMKLIRMTLKKVALAGLKYGASKLLKKVGVLSAYGPRMERKQRESDINTLRKHKLINLMLNMITFNGGEIMLQKRKTVNRSKSNPQGCEETRLSKESLNLNPKLRSEKEMGQESKKRISGKSKKVVDEKPEKGGAENLEKGVVQESKKRIYGKSEKVVDEKPEKGGAEKLEKGVVQKSPSPISDQFGVINYLPETCKPSCTWTLSPPEIRKKTEKQEIKKVHQLQESSDTESETEELLKNLEKFSELNKKQKNELRKKCQKFVDKCDFQSVGSTETVFPSFPLRSSYMEKDDSIDKVETKYVEQPSGAPYASQPLWTWRGKQSVEIFSSNEDSDSEENSFSVEKVQPQDQEKELADDFVFVKKEEFMQQKEEKKIFKDKVTLGGESRTESNIHEDCLPLSTDETEVDNQDKSSVETRTEMHDETPVSCNVKHERNQKSKEKLQSSVVIHNKESKEVILKKYCSESADSPTIQLLVTEDSPSRNTILRSIHYMPVVEKKTGKPWNGSEEDYCKILMEELKCAAEIKHGDVSSPEWRKFLEEQAGRCMTLQMLSVSHSNFAKIEVEGCTKNTKEWAFVLYNYARLSMIFKTFEECVARKDFLPLPLPDDVDFSLLNHEEEWELVWNYILRWPEILEEMALPLLDKTKKLKTATVARFLLSLSHRISEYYSRYHVLVSEPLPHMMPLMYARLYLHRAILTIMKICFNLLGVDSPPTFM